MKKEYNSPELQIVNVVIENMLVTPSTLEGQSGNNVSVGFSEEEYNGDGASRYYDDWD